MLLDLLKCVMRVRILSYKDITTHLSLSNSITKKRLRFLVSTSVASDPPWRHVKIFFLLWNDVQLQPKLLDRLEFCRALIQTTFSHRGMKVCLICEASLSHHTLYGKFNPRVYNVSHNSLLARWPGNKINKSAPPHRFWSRPMTRNRRPFWGALKMLYYQSQLNELYMYNLKCYLFVHNVSHTWCGTSISLW